MKFSSALRCIAMASLMGSFVLAPAGLHAQYNILHNFQASNDGVAPDAPLTFDSHGNLYGTTFGSGLGSGASTVFKLTPNGDGTWAESIVYIFAALTGEATPVVVDGHDQSLQFHWQEW